VILKSIVTEGFRAVMLYWW